jgi:hypothetical protein
MDVAFPLSSRKASAARGIQPSETDVRLLESCPQFPLTREGASDGRLHRLKFLVTQFLMHRAEWGRWSLPSRICVQLLRKCRQLRLNFRRGYGSEIFNLELDATVKELAN